MPPCRIPPLHLSKSSLRVKGEPTPSASSIAGSSTRVHDVEPLVVARALMRAHPAVVDHVLPQVLAGRRGRSLAADARSQIKRASDRLERASATTR